MDHRPRRRLTYANVMATLAVVLVLTGGTALAAYVVTSNSQIGPGTVSGHAPPKGDHSNIIPGSVTGADLANNSVSASKVSDTAKFRKVTKPVAPTTVISLGGLQVNYQCDFNGSEYVPTLKARTTVDHATITDGFVSGSIKFASNLDFGKTDFLSLTQNFDFGEGNATYSTPGGHVVTLSFGFESGTLDCYAHGLAVSR